MQRRSAAWLLVAALACAGDDGGGSGETDMPATTSMSTSGASSVGTSSSSGSASGAPTSETPTSGSESSATSSAESGSSDGSGSSSGGVPQSIFFAAIGDYGNDSSAEAAVAELVDSWNPEFIITMGDNNYSDGEAETIDENIGQYYQQYIGNYQGTYGDGSPENRFWPSPGNHDWHAPNLQPYLEYFTLPGNERYYDVDMGLVHLFAIDSDGDEPDGATADSVQGQWLQKALAASTACWKIVYFHHAAYSSSNHGPDEDMQWPFEEWGADAVLAGHDHSYERLAVGGIPYFVNGLGGAGPYDFPEILPESEFRYAEEHGAMTISASTTDITFEFVNIDGEVIDTHTVDKSCG